MRKAIVLLSGGLDSTTTLYLARRQGYRVSCLVFDYGQRHRKEVSMARRIARENGCACSVVRIALPWGGSALLDKKVPLPRNRTSIPKEIPATYVPARNIIFLSYAASFAEAVGAEAIFIGANAVDYSGYPDCRPAFYAAYRDVLKRGLKTGAEGRTIRVLTPLIKMSKAEIVRLGIRLGVPHELTWSCYQGGKRPCGVCDSCLLRAKGFDALGIRDPGAGVQKRSRR